MPGLFTPSDAVRYLRTYVPIAWGLLLAWLITRVPVIGDVIAYLETELGMPWLVEGIGLALTGLVVAAFYWLASKLAALSPGLSKWLLGSDQVPIYFPHPKVAEIVVTEIEIVPPDTQEKPTS